MPTSEVYNMDCMEYMKTIPDKFFDLVIADPPYGIETRGNAQDRFRKGASLKLVNDFKPSELFFNELFRVSKNQIIWGYNHLSDMLPSCREFIFWYKHNPVITFADGELAWTSFQKTARCFDYPYFGTNGVDKNKIHPTQKPTALYAWILNTYREGVTKVFDPMMGSQSSRIAAYKLGFDYYGCELDKEYFDKGCERFNKECKGEFETTDGKIITQLSLF